MMKRTLCAKKLAFTTLCVLIALGLFNYGCLHCLESTSSKVIFLNKDGRVDAHLDYGLKHQLVALSLADPVRDAQEAYSSNDYRFVGILGTGPIVPPWDFRDGSARIIAYTTDRVHSVEVEKISLLAGHYASRFNLHLKSLIEGNRGIAPKK